MCDVLLTGSGQLEIFPSIDCDDLSQVESRGVEEGQIMELEGTWVSGNSVDFVLPDGRSSSLPLRAITIVRDCGWCELSNKSE